MAFGQPKFDGGQNSKNESRKKCAERAREVCIAEEKDCKKYGSQKHYDECIQEARKKRDDAIYSCHH